MKLKDGLLYLSLVLNLGLGVHLLLGRSDSPSSATSGDLSAAHAPVSALSASTAEQIEVDAESGEYFRSLDDKGLSQTEKAALLLTHLNRKYEHQRAADQRYWTPRGAMEDALKASERTRQQVLGLVGDAAWAEPALAPLFQPYWREYPQLDPRKQVTVQRLIQEYYQSHEISQADPLEYRDGLKRSYKKLQDAVSAALTPAEYVEYSIRLSPLADAVRRMRLDLTEEQYRGLLTTIRADERFERLALRIEGQRTSLGLYVAKLSELLGKDKHLEFAARIDPIYGAMSALGKNKGMSTQAVREAYASFVAHQQAGSTASAEYRAALNSAFGPQGEFMIRQFIEQASRT